MPNKANDPARAERVAKAIRQWGGYQRPRPTMLQLLNELREKP